MTPLGRTPGGPPPVAKLIGAVVIIIVAAALGIPLTTGGNTPGTAAPPPTTTSRGTDSRATQPDRSARSPQPSTAAPAPRLPSSTPSSTAAAPNLDALQALVADRASGVMVTVHTQVYRLLDDDHDGARHQRFLISLDPGARRPRTVKVSHNVDLAPRIPLEEGDIVTIRGEFEWNDLGGVIHWTHHDPARRREGGWIEHDGRRYE